MKILISAGEASGDLYAAELAKRLRARRPKIELFGCAGPRMAEAGVRRVVDASSLAVVGLVEILRHIPRIHREYRKLIAAARRERPRLAILTDNPGFHLRVARALHREGIPVVQLVAPQVWAWRRWRLRRLRRDVKKLLCIFPFEERFFRERGVDAVYIGHPLSGLIAAHTPREEFRRRHGIPEDRPLVVLLPGSRRDEVARHLPVVAGAAEQILQRRPTSFLLAAPPGALERWGGNFWEPISRLAIQVIEGETWDAIAHADLALAACGTVTVEAALLRTPMVTFYRVSPLTWRLGRLLVRVPYYSMVNLIAGEPVAAELVQERCTPESLAGEVQRLLEDPPAREAMKRNLEAVRAKLFSDADPMETAAKLVEDLL